MKRYPIVFSIGASDSLGSAGIEADIKTVSSLGAYAVHALTSIAVQTSRGTIEDIHPVPIDAIKQQIKVIMEGIRPDVVKIGFVNDADVIYAISDGLRKYHPRYVVFDPVILSVSGHRMLTDEIIKVIQQELFHFTNLICMTQEEAEVLTNIKVLSIEGMKQSALELSEMSNMSVLIKSKETGDSEIHHVLHLPTGEEWLYKLDLIRRPKIHGVGSTFSAAIATYIAFGDDLTTAIQKAQKYIIQAIAAGENVRIGKSANSICHSFDPQKMRVFDSVI